MRIIITEGRKCCVSSKRADFHEGEGAEGKRQSSHFHELYYNLK